MSLVYVVRAGSFYKIGKTDKIKKRISALQTANAAEIVLIAQFKCGDAKNAFSTESKLHKTFRKCKVSGEWFSLTDDELNAVLRLADQYSRLIRGDLVCPKCFGEALIRGRYIFKNATEHIGASCKQCRSFFYLKHSKVRKSFDIAQIPIVKSNLVTVS